MRAYASFPVVLTLVLTLPTAAFADPTEGREMVWEGYLFRGRDGLVRLGWPVIAMGVPGTGSRTWAVTAVSRANPTTRAIVAVARRGKATPPMTFGWTACISNPLVGGRLPGSSGGR